MLSPECPPFFIIKGSDGVDTSGAANEELTLVFGVEVEQIFTCEHIGGKLESARQTGLLVYGKEGLDCGVAERVVDKHSQRSSHTDTAVGTEGCALGLHPLAVDVGADGVVHKVVLHVGVLLAHHIGMCLEYNCFVTFVAGGCGLADNHIGGCIDLVFEVVFLGKIDQIGGNFFFVFRGAWHASNLVEDAPHERGLEVCNHSNY